MTTASRMLVNSTNTSTAATVAATMPATAMNRPRASAALRRSAAEHFLKLGFKTVYNLTGGIDAWSRDIDPKVPRY
jgi:hypothetical protein